MDVNNLSEGYYWVKVDGEFDGDWVVSQYNQDTGFWFTGIDWYMSADYITCIGDKIERLIK